MGAARRPRGATRRRSTPRPSARTSRDHWKWQRTGSRAATLGRPTREVKPWRSPRLEETLRFPDVSGRARRSLGKEGGHVGGVARERGHLRKAHCTRNRRRRHHRARARFAGLELHVARDGAAPQAFEHGPAASRRRFPRRSAENARRRTPNTSTGRAANCGDFLGPARRVSRNLPDCRSFDNVAAGGARLAPLGTEGDGEHGLVRSRGDPPERCERSWPVHIEHDRSRIALKRGRLAPGTIAVSIRRLGPLGHRISREIDQARAVLWKWSCAAQGPSIGLPRHAVTEIGRSPKSDGLVNLGSFRCAASRPPRSSRRAVRPCRDTLRRKALRV